MIDYAKNIQAFYERDDYKALAGQPGATAVEASFKDLTYVPRKTKPLPGMMAGTMLQEFALQPQQPPAQEKGAGKEAPWHLSAYSVLQSALLLLQLLPQSL